MNRMMQLGAYRKRSGTKVVMDSGKEYILEMDVKEFRRRFFQAFNDSTVSYGIIQLGPVTLVAQHVSSYERM